MYRFGSRHFRVFGFGAALTLVICSLFICALSGCRSSSARLQRTAFEWPADSEEQQGPSEGDERSDRHVQAGRKKCVHPAAVNAPGNYWRCEFIQEEGVDECGKHEDCNHSTCSLPVGVVDPIGHCIYQPGPGHSDCATNDDCNHTVCDNKRCIKKAGPGEYQCRQDRDCYHKKCVIWETWGSEVTGCYERVGKGIDECDTNDDCGHRDCVGDSCHFVPGKGENLCRDSSDCSHCEGSRCVRGPPGSSGIGCNSQMRQPGHEEPFPETCMRCDLETLRCVGVNDSNRNNHSCKTDLECEAYRCDPGTGMCVLGGSGMTCNPGSPDDCRRLACAKSHEASFCVPGGAGMPCEQEGSPCTGRNYCIATSRCIYGFLPIPTNRFVECSKDKDCMKSCDESGQCLIGGGGPPCSAGVPCPRGCVGHNNLLLCGFNSSEHPLGLDACDPNKNDPDLKINNPDCLVKSCLGGLCVPGRSGGSSCIKDSDCHFFGCYFGRCMSVQGFSQSDRRCDGKVEGDKCAPLPGSDLAAANQASGTSAPTADVRPEQKLENDVSGRILTAVKDLPSVALGATTKATKSAGFDIYVIQDPTCGQCRHAFNELFRWWSSSESVELREGLRFVVVGLPLGNSRKATELIHAMYCAAEQNPKYGIELVQSFFSTPYVDGDAMRIDLASATGLNVGKYKACNAAKRYESKISSLYTLLSEAGINGTPTLLVRPTGSDTTSMILGFPRPVELLLERISKLP